MRYAVRSLVLDNSVSRSGMTGTVEKHGRAVGASHHFRL